METSSIPDDSVPPPLCEEPFEGDEELSPGASGWIVAAHLAPLLAYAFYWIPGSGAFLAAPLVIRRLRGATHPLVADQALEAFQFHLVAASIALVVGLTIVGWVLAWFVVAASAVLALIAALRASRGERYRYPWIPRVLDATERDPGP